MKHNVRDSFALLFQLEKLANERQSIYTEAIERWPSTEPGRVRHAGFSAKLTALFPSLFGDYGELRSGLELVAEWDLELVPESHPARAAVVVRQKVEAATAAMYQHRPGHRIGNV
jgi:hypothetical protein